MVYSLRFADEKETLQYAGRGTPLNRGISRQEKAQTIVVQVANKLFWPLDSLTSWSWPVSAAIAHMGDGK